MFESTISMLRVTDARASEAFYCQKLGFQKSWEFDPGEGEPIFIEVTRDKVSLHLSEHEGDGPAGVQLYVNVVDARQLYDEITGKGISIDHEPYEAEWGHMVFELQDLDGNTLRIGSPIG